METIIGNYAFVTEQSINGLAAAENSYGCKIQAKYPGLIRIYNKDVQPFSNELLFRKAHGAVSFNNRCVFIKLQHRMTADFNPN